MASIDEAQRPLDHRSVRRGEIGVRSNIGVDHGEHGIGRASIGQGEVSIHLWSRGVILPTLISRANGRLLPEVAG